MMRAVIVGASGYTGRELVRLLAGHPSVEIAGLFASEKTGAAEVSYGQIFAEMRRVCDEPVRATSPGAIRAAEPDVVFLATPHELSAELAWPLAIANIPVVDLSGAHRLGVDDYPAHYGFQHPHPEAVESAVYGLPELGRDGLADAPIIAAAGCYVTAASVPLAILDRAGVLASDFVPAITAMSGVSGAGRAARAHTAYCEVSAQPYGVLEHRHQPEIAMAVGRPVGFVPVLGPWDRGIVCTTHAALGAGITARDVREALVATGTREPFLRVLPAGEWPSVNAVKNTNFLDISVAVDESMGRVVLCSTLDNLVKGASGQAVQCMNARFGLPETLGLIPGALQTAGGAS